MQLLAGGHNANISAVSATVRIPNYSGSYPILEVMKSTSNNRHKKYCFEKKLIYYYLDVAPDFHVLCIGMLEAG